MSDQTTIKIPATFYFDHMDRGLPTPEAVKETKRNVWVRADDPALPELRDDAEYYAHPYGPDEAPPGLRTAARALLRVLDQAGLTATTVEGQWEWEGDGWTLIPEGELGS